MSAKKSVAYNQLREQSFNASAFHCKLQEYNALQDPNMQHYFENKKVQSLLYQTGQIDRHGRIIDLKKNQGKIKILDREFSRAEKLEEQRRKEEMEMRVILEKLSIISCSISSYIVSSIEYNVNVSMSLRRNEKKIFSTS